MSNRQAVHCLDGSTDFGESRATNTLRHQGRIRIQKYTPSRMKARRWERFRFTAFCRFTTIGTLDVSQSLKRYDRLRTGARRRTAMAHQARTTGMNLQFDDGFAPVIGVANPAGNLRTDIVAPALPDDASDLDIHLARLLALHPDIPVTFRNQDLTQLDDLTKQAVLDGVNHLPWIQPLKASSNAFNG